MADNVEFMVNNDKVEANNVRALFKGMGENEKDEMHVNLTREGIIVDYIDSRGEVVATTTMDLDVLEHHCN